MRRYPGTDFLLVPISALGSLNSMWGCSEEEGRWGSWDRKLGDVGNRGRKEVEWGRREYTHT